MVSGPVSPLPLDGVRVLDLTRLLPGAVCTQLLADYGADVVKVERPPGGDDSRRVGHQVGRASATHHQMDRGKRSVTLDLSVPSAGRVTERLGCWANVVVESFRPGVAERLGVGFDRLAGFNPYVVYCSITGYPSETGLASMAGHDIDFIARAGILAMSPGGHDGALPGTLMADAAGGMLGAFAIVSALLRRAAVDGPQRLEVPLSDAALFIASPLLADVLAGGPTTAGGAVTGRSAAYRTYRCADGRWVAVGALEPRFWNALVRAVGLDELVDRPDAPEAMAALADVFARRSQAAWLDRLADVDSCVVGVQHPDEVPGDPVYREGESVISIPGPGDRQLTQVAPPVRVDGRRPRPSQAATDIPGDDSDELLWTLGFTEPERTALRDEGALG